MTLFRKLTSLANELLDFQSRVWVVKVIEGSQKGDVFTVSEDSFKTPLQWMKNKGFSDQMLTKVEAIKVSATADFAVGDTHYRLLRVK